jgi:hypothetical protein
MAPLLSFVNPSMVSWVDPEDNDFDNYVETPPAAEKLSKLSKIPAPSSSKHMMMSLIKSLLDDIRRKGLRPGPIGKPFTASHEFNGVSYIQFFQGVRDHRTGELRPERLWGRKTVIEQINDQLRHYMTVANRQLKVELVYDPEQQMYSTFLM